MSKIFALLVILLLSVGNAFSELSVDSSAPVYSGMTTVLEVSGALPGSTVRVFASRSGIGSGPCEGDFCLDILGPVIPLGEFQTDTDGSASFPFNVPATESGLMYLQAVELDPGLVGNVTPVKIWARKKVLMIGDSITQGQQSLPAGQQYTTVAAAILGPQYEVVEIGCGGASSGDWLPFGDVTLCGGEFWSPNIYLNRALPNLPAEMVTIMLGTNDATGFFEPAPITPEQYRENMSDLVTSLINDGAEQVLLMSPPPMCAAADPLTVGRLTAYRLIIKDLCETLPGVICGPDVYTLLNPEDFAGCDVHPNGVGHQKLGIAVAKAISE